jgi:hypothetical protein
LLLFRDGLLWTGGSVLNRADYFLYFFGIQHFYGNFPRLIDYDWSGWKPFLYDHVPHACFTHLQAFLGAAPFSVRVVDAGQQSYVMPTVV